VFKPAAQRWTAPNHRGKPACGPLEDRPGDVRATPSRNGLFGDSSQKRRKKERLQIYDHDATLLILVSLGLLGRLIDVERQLEARLLGVRLPPLCFLASANLLDDERG
jgi:hypothetical protein